MEQGLVSNSVLSICQDAKGFMWFGTSNGLNRYDGYRFRLYQKGKDSTTLSDNNITSLLFDSKATLWIGTGGGLDKYNPATDTFERIWLEGSRVGNIHSLYEDRVGAIWVGTANGLYLLKNTSNKTVRSFFPNYIIRAIYEDKEGALWVGTNKGLAKMTIRNQEYRVDFYTHASEKPGSISSNSITSIAEDGYQKLWIGTENAGINYYTRSTGAFTRIGAAPAEKFRLIHNNVREILSINNQIWVGTQEGLSVIDPVKLEIRSYQHNTADKNSLSQNSIYTLYKDAAQLIWIGTYFGGVNTIYPISTVFTTIQQEENKNSLSNDIVSGMAEDHNKNIWIGTEGGGLNLLNRKTGKFTVYTNKPDDPNSLSSNLVKNVYIDKDQHIWVGTHGGGVSVFNTRTGKFTRHLLDKDETSILSSETTHILEDDNERCWIIKNKRAQVFKRNGTALEPYALSDSLPSYPKDFVVSAVFKDSLHQLWIGGDAGLLKIVHNTVTVIDTNSAVNCLAEDSEGNIWLGTKFSGLVKYSPTTGILERSGENIPYAATSILGILIEKGNYLLREPDKIWMSTDRGIIKYHPSSKSFQLFTTSDGLAGNLFNANSYLKDSEGMLYFGGLQGITRFNPQLIECNYLVSPLLFTGITVTATKEATRIGTHEFRNPSDSLPSLTLKHNQNTFTIDFALLNYIKTDKNTYSYLLSGFDLTWNSTQLPAATYTNLPPGKYTFTVKGANNDGVWSPVKKFQIIILPPIWLTWWAYSAYFIVLAGILFFVLRSFHMKALLNKENELHQLKLDFFTNISHEIRTHLTLIMLPLEQLVNKKDPGSIDYPVLNRIKLNTTRLLTLVTELLDFRKIEKNNHSLQLTPTNLIPYLERIYDSFVELSLSKDIRFSFIHDVDSIYLAIDKDQFQKVLINLLDNAFKYTDAGGQVILQIKEDDQQVTITVSDNGRGIDPNYHEKLFNNFFQVAEHGPQNTGYGIGLALAKQIVELHKGTITINSQVSTPSETGSTSFTVTLQKELLQPTSNTARYTDTVYDEPTKVGNTISTDQPGSSFTILLAEDNPELTQLIIDSFSASYTVVAVENGQEAFEKALELLPDIIISDVMMPVMSGLELCNKLKTDPATSHIPVILLTAKSTQNDHLSGFNNGADIYITKPFHLKALALNVRNLLRLKEKMRVNFGQDLFRDSLTNTKDDSTIEIKLPNSIDTISSKH
ncbi:two-component regulator propeller domain-containing protein [Flavihumibacter sp. CACIAM 22H1]|uniref:hybrid sensor histidine kinase/response regulator n=1 Tax=Flavihumibacter sp. CACIAM 22H1 TaxID=1812911 RepID=UPI0025B86789|nr:two-component regulator propeller domain-containing protein [Flavihumibacter sp. CACIAM 22H1]